MLLTVLSEGSKSVLPIGVVSLRKVVNGRRNQICILLAFSVFLLCILFSSFNLLSIQVALPLGSLHRRHEMTQRLKYRVLSAHAPHLH